MERELGLLAKPFTNNFWALAYPEIIRLALEESELPPETYPVFASKDPICVIKTAAVKKTVRGKDAKNNGGRSSILFFFFL